ncbi:MAG: hypothetical protein H7Y19_12675 [Luteimonas sp.]|nr:hypothetical protein [Luteimonas sp.]
MWVNTLASGPWSVTGTLNHVGSFDLTDPSLGVNNCVDGLGIGSAAAVHAVQLGNGIVPDALSCRVASLTTPDLFASCTFNRQLSMQWAVLNALNAGAPADRGTYMPGAASRSTPRFIRARHRPLLYRQGDLCLLMMTS